MFSQLPRWGLLVVLIGIGGVALILAGGAANPPRAGELRQTLAPLDPLPLPVRSEILAPYGMELPPPPFTLEIAASLDPQSDPLSGWGIAFFDSPEKESWRVVITGDSYYRISPFQPDSTSFFHIRPPGQDNLISLNISAEGSSTLRINHEIAWRGYLPLSMRWQIVLAGGSGRGSLHAKQAALYH